MIGLTTRQLGHCQEIVLIRFTTGTTMILLKSRRVFRNREIELDSWLRAPMSLNNGSELYLSVNGVAYQDAPRAVEIVGSHYPPDTWSDLWRLEIETVDKIGNLARVLHILARAGIRVMSSEGSISADGELHEMDFVLSAKNYSDERDSNTARRSASPTCQLVGLFDELAVNLIEQLNFRVDGAPKIKLRRMLAHYDLYQRATPNGNADAQSFIRPHRCVVNRGRLKVSEEFEKQIQEISGVTVEGQLEYSASVDTKDRLLRILLFNSAMHKVCHVQVLCTSDSSVLSEIGALLAGEVRDKADARVNIVRFQIRPGWNMAAKRGKHSVPSNAVRLDITFVPDRPWHSVSAMYETLRKRIEELPAMRIVGGKVIASHDSEYGTKP